MPVRTYTNRLAAWPKSLLRLSLANILLLAILVVSAQQKISGRITGIDGSPLPGAGVQIKFSNLGTTADQNGRFEITAKQGDLLVISNIGYLTREIKSGNDNFLQISLTPSLVNLNEVVVTGYTSQKIKEITGSVAVVKIKDLVAVPAGQVEQMLQGRVAGLNVISSGQPGGGGNIRLHGIGNFGDVTPLYIIDGVEGNINNLNPDDVESLQVLKDASSYSIYGVRGANGVIVITTKKGKTLKPLVTYNFYLGYQIPLAEGLNALSPIEEANLLWLRDKNSGIPPGNKLYGYAEFPVLPDYIVNGAGYMANAPEVDPALYNIDHTRGPIYQIVKANKTGTDWFHEVFKPAFNQNHTITVAAANDNNRYLFSFGYLNQQGTLLNTYLKRYTARINTEFTVKNNIRLGENIQGTYTDNPVIPNQRNDWLNTIMVLNNTDPAITTNPSASSLLPVYDIKGNWATFGLPISGFVDNVAGERAMTKNNINSNWEIFGNLYGEVDFLKYFTARTSFGGTINNYYYHYYHYAANFQVDNSSSERAGFQTSGTWTNTVNFSVVFAKNNHVKMLMGSEAIDNYNREVDAGRSGFFLNDPNYAVLSNGAYGITNNSFAARSALFSLFGQLNYSYKEKYFFTATLRRDGSSVFGPEKRYGWFPAFGAAWLISGEKFMRELGWVSELKLRLSHGITGYNRNVDPGNQYALYSTRAGRSFYDISGTSTSPSAGSYNSRIGNPQTGWQQDIVTNIGFDGIFWNGKLSVTADWYKKESSGLLFPVGSSLVSSDVVFIGDPDDEPVENIGNVLNKGLDLLLGTKGDFAKNWQWDATLTFSVYKNKIAHLNAINYLQEGIVRSEVGHSMGQYYGYKIIGIFQNQDEVLKSPSQDGAAPGKFKYFDANSNGRIDDSDRVFIGNSNPKFTAGLNINLSWKAFDLSAFFYGSFGNDLHNDVNAHGGSKATLYNSWTPERSGNIIPIALVNGNVDFSEFGTNNSFKVEKGTYLRNKSLILGYTLPKTVLQKIGLNYLRVYLQALNLFTITKYSGLDPELTGSNVTGNESSEINPSVFSTSVAAPSANFGGDVGAYPNGQKQYLIGINVSF